MGKITEELLRKKAEHNDGILSTLEEISLHQCSIEKIENLEFYCRHLKILYLQDNIIEKLENLDKLKELEYLNLAVNSITKIENLEACESLYKLDMTLNFVDIEDLKESVDCLAKMPAIREIYLTGNGCESFKYWKEYIIARVPQIIIIDGTEVLKSDRIKSAQMLPMIEKELEKASEEHIIFKENDPGQKDPNKYSPQYRRTLYKELEEDKIKREEERTKPKEWSPWNYEKEKKDPPSVYKPDGEIRVCNQGRYEVLMDEDIFDTAVTTWQIKIPKYMDTSKVKVDLHPQYVRVDVNGLITQWRFNYDIMCEKATVERSSTTGVLVVKAPIAGKKPREKKKKEKEEDIKKENPKIEEDKKKNKKELKVLKEDIDFKRDEKNGIKIVESFEQKKDINEISKECGVDLDEVPDLD